MYSVKGGVINSFELLEQVTYFLMAKKAVNIRGGELWMQAVG